MASSVLAELGIRINQTKVALTSLHLTEVSDLDRASDLRVIKHNRKCYVILAEWASKGQDVLFKTGYDRVVDVRDNDVSSTGAIIIAKRAPSNGTRPHKVTTTLDDACFKELSEQAVLSEWSISQVLRSVVRQWYQARERIRR